MDIKSMFDIRANSAPKIISTDGEFYNNFVEYIGANSKLLNRCIIVEGNPQQNYYFDFENSAMVNEGNITNPLGYRNPKSFSCIPKLLVSEFKMSHNKFDIFFNKVDEKLIFENILYKPFLRSIEKNVISGTYFDKSLFETSQIITGTNDFNGLLKLVRNLKDKNENNVVVINPKIMYNILDTITKDGYLNEYLLSKTIEGVKIIETLECPDTKIAGVDPTRICLVMYSNLEIKKLSVIGTIDYIFHVYYYANGGDIFDSSILMEI